MTDELKPTLLPCPFCGPMEGNKPFVHKRRAAKLGPDRYHYMARHPYCGAEGGQRLTESDAIEAWNCRPSPGAGESAPQPAMWPDPHDDNPHAGQCCNRASRKVFGDCPYCGRKAK